MSKIAIIEKIIIHCSDSDFGDAKKINEWHLDRGWDGIGYHRVILNGVRQSLRPYEAEDDGVIEYGRDLDVQGAHVKGQNHNSIGICLIGRLHFTARQLLGTLPSQCLELLNQFNLTPEDIRGHCEFDNKKTCPNIDMAVLRKMIALQWDRQIKRSSR